MQVEVFTQFFLGYYTQDMTYKDDLSGSIRRNLSSISGFWFDCITSIPWSFMDLHFYLVVLASLKPNTFVYGSLFRLPSLISTHSAHEHRPHLMDTKIKINIDCLLS